MCAIDCVMLAVDCFISRVVHSTQLITLLEPIERLKLKRFNSTDRHQSIEGEEQSTNVTVQTNKRFSNQLRDSTVWTTVD